MTRDRAARAAPPRARRRIRLAGPRPARRAHHRAAAHAAEGAPPPGRARGRVGREDLRRAARRSRARRGTRAVHRGRRAARSGGSRSRRSTRPTSTSSGSPRTSGRRTGPSTNAVAPWRRRRTSRDLQARLADRTREAVAKAVTATAPGAGRGGRGGRGPARPDAASRDGAAASATARRPRARGTVGDHDLGVGRAARPRRHAPGGQRDPRLPRARRREELGRAAPRRHGGGARPGVAPRHPAPARAGHADAGRLRAGAPLERGEARARDERVPGHPRAARRLRRGLRRRRAAGAASRRAAAHAGRVRGRARRDRREHRRADVRDGRAGRPHPPHRSRGRPGDLGRRRASS